MQNSTQEGIPVGIAARRERTLPSRGVLLMGIYRSYSLELVSGRDVEHKPLVVVPAAFHPYRNPGIA